jgi:hypothetical protein
LRPANGVIIRFVAGYGAAAAVPYHIKRAMLKYIELHHDYHNPEESARLQEEIEDLLWEERKNVF